MKTRKQYLNDECTHDEYYAQFVTPLMIDGISQYVGKDKLLASKDESLNDIKLSTWDGFNVHYYGVNGMLENAGDFLTQSGVVCIAKAAAKIWIKNN